MSTEPEEIPGELVLNLRKPVTLGSGDASVTYTQLVLREPTAAEWLRWDKLEGVESNIMAVTVVSGLPQLAVEKIGVRDLNAATKYLNSFFA